MIIAYLGENIKKYRRDKDLTQKQLSQKANVPYTTLIKIENGFVKNPKIETIAKISKALNISIDLLIYG